MLASGEKVVLSPPCEKRWGETEIQKVLFKIPYQAELRILTKRLDTIVMH